MTAPATADHLMSRKRPLEKKTNIYHNDEVVEAFQVANQALEISKLVDEAGSPERTAAQSAFDAAKADLDAETTVLKLRSLGRKRFDAMKTEHPPTAKNDEEAMKVTGQKAHYNIDTFIPALLHETIYEPKFTLEQTTQMCEDWTEGEISKLYSLALSVNTESRDDVLGKG